MKLLINEQEYEIERLSLSTMYLKEQNSLRQNLSISIKQGSIINEISTELIQELQEGITIITSNEEELLLTGFNFESFDVYMDSIDERFDLRFTKEEGKEEQE